MSVAWRVRVGELESGPYTKGELTELVKRGLNNAVVKPEGGNWVHLTMSPFAELLPKPKSHFGWKLLAVVLAVLAVLVMVSTCSVKMTFLPR